MTNGRVQVIERSLDILEALSEGPRSLSDICRETSLSKGTAFRLLDGLSGRGIVIKDPATAHYMLGPGLLRLVQGALSGIGAIATLGRAALELLAERTQETVALHVQTGVERVCVDEVASPQMIRYTSSVGSSAPLHVGSAGKVLLAFMSDTDRERSLSLLTRGVEHEIDLDSLAVTLAQVAQDGWAVSVGERVEGASAISVPVRSHLLLLSLSVLGPTQRLPRERLLELLPEMRATASEIESLLDQGRPDTKLEATTN